MPLAAVPGVPRSSKSESGGGRTIDRCQHSCSPCCLFEGSFTAFIMNVHHLVSIGALAIAVLQGYRHHAPYSTNGAFQLGLDAVSAEQ